MAKWLTTFILIAVLVGNATTGFSMHPAESGCSMPGCCEAARAPQESTPEQVAAQMCCTMSCPQPVPTGSTGGIRISPLVIIFLHPAVLRPPMTVPDSNQRAHLTQPYPSNPQPIYIRHLALLI